MLKDSEECVNIKLRLRGKYMYMKINDKLLKILYNKIKFWLLFKS